MGYFSTFLILHLILKHSFPSCGLGSRLSMSNGIQKLGVSFGVWLWAVSVCYSRWVLLHVQWSVLTKGSCSRYFLSYHTSKQVVAGYLFGVVWGLFYHYLVESANKQTMEMRRAILDSTFARCWRIRDGWAVYHDGGIEEEYTIWRSLWERSQRDRKKTA